MKYILNNFYKFYKNKNTQNKFIWTSLFGVWMYSVTNQVHYGKFSNSSFRIPIN